jgi:hypothetical protein
LWYSKNKSYDKINNRKTMTDYSPEKLQLLYEKLPEDLQEAIFSEKTANIIYNICLENGLKEKNQEMAKYIGHVLIGLLPPGELQKKLEKNLEVSNDSAEKMAAEINSLIFFPLKESLENLYGIEIKNYTGPLKEPAPKTKDKYQEPVE